MSPLLRDRLLVSLAPRAAAWIRLSGAWQRHIAAKGLVEADPGYGAEPWQGAVEALRREATAWRAERIEVSVVLSNHFVRYAVVPAPERAAGEEEELALARHHFARIHGERAKNWEIRLAPERSGAPRLACAVDAGLIRGLKESFPGTARPRLVSIQPYLMSAFNERRDQVPPGGAWFVLVEPGRACLAAFVGGAWQAIQNVRGAFAAPEEREALIERERHRAGIERSPEPVFQFTQDDPFAIALTAR